jgi:hypothetical protein
MPFTRTRKRWQLIGVIVYTRNAGDGHVRRGELAKLIIIIVGVVGMWQVVGEWWVLVIIYRYQVAHTVCRRCLVEVFYTQAISYSVVNVYAEFG